MKCPFCTNQPYMPMWDDIVTHLVVTKDSNEHYHVHGPFHNPSEIEAMINVIIHQLNQPDCIALEPSINTIDSINKNRKLLILNT